MKKYIIIALILLVGGALLVYPLFKGDDVVDYKPAAVFGFQDNLAAIDGDQKARVKIEVNEELSELTVYYNDSLVATWNNVSSDVEFELDAAAFGIGTRYILLRAKRKDGTSSEDRRMVRVLSDILPVQLVAKEIASYPHLTSSFTQGLEFYKGELFEGTGDPNNIGASYVTVVDLTSGEWGRKMGVPGYFGEGITLLNDKLYQLTYKTGKCFVYSPDKMEHLKEFNYPGEGWGLCNDGKQLIMSNGSEELFFRDPESFSIIRTIQVYDNTGPVTDLNELEYIDGLIYANVWMTNRAVVIDPKTGKVLKNIDAGSLAISGKGNGDVLNGIAHNPATGKTYMTGKYWSKLFEVEFVGEEQLP